MSKYDKYFTRDLTLHIAVCALKIDNKDDDAMEFDAESIPSCSKSINLGKDNSTTKMK